MSTPTNPIADTTARLSPQTPPPVAQGTGLQEPTPTINIREHKAKTARILAIAFILILSLSFALNYGTFLLLIYTGHSADLEKVERLFNVWLPVISGLTGVVATYYFTRDKE